MPNRHGHRRIDRAIRKVAILLHSVQEEAVAAGMPRLTFYGPRII
jgi:hypothetical protein